MKLADCGVLEDMEHVIKWCGIFDDVRRKFGMKLDIEMDNLIFSGRYTINVSSKLMY